MARNCEQILDPKAKPDKRQNTKSDNKVLKELSTPKEIRLGSWGESDSPTIASVYFKRLDGNLIRAYLCMSLKKVTLPRYLRARSRYEHMNETK